MTIRESGFEAISERLRQKAFDENGQGWEFQLVNLARHLTLQ